MLPSQSIINRRNGASQKLGSPFTPEGELGFEFAQTLMLGQEVQVTLRQTDQLAIQSEDFTWLCSDVVWLRDAEVTMLAPGFPRVSGTVVERGGIDGYQGDLVEASLVDGAEVALVAVCASVVVYLSDLTDLL